jgi:hypothetical protein
MEGLTKHYITDWKRNKATDWIGAGVVSLLLATTTTTTTITTTTSIYSFLCVCVFFHLGHNRGRWPAAFIDYTVSMWLCFGN